MTEAELQRSVRHLAAMLGIKSYHTHDSRRSDPGFPDLVLVGTRVIFAELKSASGKPSREQRIWGLALKRAGQTWVIWKPADWHSGIICQTLLSIAPGRTVA